MVEQKGPKIEGLVRKVTIGLESWNLGFTGDGEAFLFDENIAVRATPQQLDQVVRTGVTYQANDFRESIT